MVYISKGKGNEKEEVEVRGDSDRNDHFRFPGFPFSFFCSFSPSSPRCLCTNRAEYSLVQSLSTKKMEVMMVRESAQNNDAGPN